MSKDSPFQDLMGSQGDAAMLTAALNLVQAVNRIDKTLSAIFPIGGATSTTVGAAGAASALPATPEGYLAVTLPDGTAVKIPYYNP